MIAPSYPRLTAHDATELLLALSGPLTAAERLALGSEYEGRSKPSAVASSVVSRDALQRLRAAVVDVAQRYGFPHERREGGNRADKFDSVLPAVLIEHLDISPAEAGREDVWNYLTLVLLPDVALWRWPNPEFKPRYERLVGTPRNVFRLLRHRALVFGPELLMRMTADDLQQVEERTVSVGGDPRVSKVVVAAYLDERSGWRVGAAGSERELTSTERESLTRQFMKACTQFGRVYAFSLMDEQALRVLTEEILMELASSGKVEVGGDLVTEGEGDAGPAHDSVGRSPSAEVPAASATSAQGGLGPSGPVSTLAEVVEPLGSRTWGHQEAEDPLSSALEELLRRAEAVVPSHTQALRLERGDATTEDFVRQQIAGLSPSLYFQALWRAGRLDLSIERLVLAEPHLSRLGAEPTAGARRRLAQYGLVV